MAGKSKKKKENVAGLLGVGLDNEDGHHRPTRGEEFVLVGGSQETHERMQEVAIKVAESLQTRGKRLQDAAPQEVADLVLKAMGQ